MKTAICYYSRHHGNTKKVLDAMAQVGRALPHALRETGQGGLAATPFGMKYAPENAGREG